MEQRRYELLQQESTQRHEQLLELLSNQLYQLKPKSPSPTVISEERGILPTPCKVSDKADNITQFNINEPQNYIPYPRLEFSMFDGENPQGWLRRCKRYYEIFQIPENQKIEIAAMHIEGRADMWLQGFLMGKGVVTWKEFTTEVC